jgi:predicted aconitase
MSFEVRDLSDLRLLPEGAEMLSGHHGEAVRRVSSTKLQVAEFFGAERFVPITNAPFMGTSKS